MGRTALVQDLSRALPGLRTSADEADRVAYARDLWPRHHLDVRAGRPGEHRPGAIAWPSSTDEVARLVGWARREGIAVVPFGAGSGVCAGVLPSEDVLIVDLKRMARVRAIDSSAHRGRRGGAHGRAARAGARPGGLHPRPLPLLDPVQHRGRMVAAAQRRAVLGRVREDRRPWSSRSSA